MKVQVYVKKLSDSVLYETLSFITMKVIIFTRRSL